MPSVPSKIGPYHILRRIAGGCMAELFSAVLSSECCPTKMVVIKKLHFLFEGKQEYEALLEQEARLLSQLKHPNLCQLIGWGRVLNTPYMVMEMISGKNLKQIAEYYRNHHALLPLDIVLYIIEQIAEALTYVHHIAADEEAKPLKIIHRDVSPHNVMISYAGEIKLLDFGIAIYADDPWPRDWDPVQGKIGYMSPEQVQGEKLDHRSDLFSLGTILGELLSGHRMFKSHDETTTRQKILTAAIPSLEQWPTHVAELMLPILQRMLAPNKEERFDTAQNLCNELIKVRQPLDNKMNQHGMASWMERTFPLKRNRMTKNQLSL